MPNDGTSSTGGTPAAGGGAAGGGAAAPLWTDGLADDLKGYVELKGFKDAGSVVSSYREFEKLHGVPKERLMKLPENLDDDTAMGEVYSRIGRPEKPEGYTLKVPEGVKPEFSQWAQQEFHKLGLTKKQGEKLVESWNARALADHDAATTAAKDAAQQQVQKLKEEWGAAYDQNSELVEKYLAKIGVDEKTLNALDHALGIDVVTKLFFNSMQKFGIGASQLGEHTFHGDDKGGGTGNGFGILSPAAANARLEELQTDKEWIARYAAGGKAEAAEFDRLTRWSMGMK